MDEAEYKPEIKEQIINIYAAIDTTRYIFIILMY